MEMYKRAVKSQVRFESSRGVLTTEQLFQVPLSGEFSLDNLAKAVNRNLKEIEEESFVSAPSEEKDLLQFKLDILKDVISERIKDSEIKSERIAKNDMKQKLKSLLAEKKDAALSDLSEEDILKRLEELD